MQFEGLLSNVTQVGKYTLTCKSIYQSRSRFMRMRIYAEEVVLCVKIVSTYLHEIRARL